MAFSITSVEPISPTRVRVDFSTQMIDDDELADPSNYQVVVTGSGAASVLVESVTVPPGYPFPFFVVMETTEHTADRTYEVSVSGINAQNEDVSDGVAVEYVALGDSPAIFSVLPTSSTTVEITFDEAIEANRSARTASNYVWTNGLQTTEVLSVKGSIVTLKTTEQQSGELYSLTVFGVYEYGSDLVETFTMVDTIEIVEIVEGEEPRDSMTAIDTLSIEAVPHMIHSEMMGFTDSIVIGELFEETKAETATTSDSLSVDFQVGISDVVMLVMDSSNLSITENYIAGVINDSGEYNLTLRNQSSANFVNIQGYQCVIIPYEAAAALQATSSGRSLFGQLRAGSVPFFLTTTLGSSMYRCGFVPLASLTENEDFSDLIVSVYSHPSMVSVPPGNYQIKPANAYHVFEAVSWYGAKVASHSGGNASIVAIPVGTNVNEGVVADSRRVFFGYWRYGWYVKPIFSSLFLSSLGWASGRI